jgi:4'-phosphopantetheinyl transferase
MQPIEVGGAVVWLLDVDRAEPGGWELLAPGEREEFEAIRAPAARRARMVTRAALRRVLGEQLGCAAAEVPLVRTPAGKPVLAVPAPVHFSVSHTDRRAAIAVAATPVGIDVERCDPMPFREVAGAYLHPDELEALTRVSRRQGSAADELLAALWTGKEAVAKLLGTGFLHLDPAELVFAVPPDAPPWPRVVPAAPGRLSVSWFQSDAGHVVAVALSAGRL